MGIEEAAIDFLKSKTREKTFIDKLMAKEDIAQMQVLCKKEKLTRGEILELLHLCLSSELKLTNFDKNERYILGKYFVWVRDTVKISEIFFDHFEAIEKKQRESKVDKKELVMVNRLKSNCHSLIEHNVKFMVDMFIYIVRSSMSINGSTFSEILSNKFELDYRIPIQNQNNSGGVK